MKNVSVIILFCLLSLLSWSQNFDLEGIKLRMNNNANDTLRIVQLDSLAIGYSEINPDSSIRYSEMQLVFSRKLGFLINEAAAQNMSAYALLNLGNYPASLQTFLSGIEIANDPKSEKNIIPEKYRRTFGIKSDELSPRIYRLQILSFLYLNLGILYENVGNREKALQNYNLALQIGELTNNKQITGGTCMNIGRIYLFLNKNDSALLFEKRGYDTFRSIGLYDYMGSTLLNLGRIYLANGEEAIAVNYIHEAISMSTQQNYLRGVIAGNLLLGEICLKNKINDSAYIFTQNALHIAHKVNAPDLLLRSYNALSNYYQAVKNNDSVVKYLSLVIRIKDSIFNSKQTRQFQNIDFDAQKRQQELDTAKKDFREKVLKYVLMLGLVVVFIVSIILWRNYRNKQSAYKLLALQQQVTEEQKTRVEQALEELKKTQAHLIQKEKMASLGELTAGIAHEIQNPLNFVNNFSEVNKELLVEMNEEIEKGNLEEVKSIAKDVTENEEKINHHGKKADAIVKGMLQHSRSSSGVKEPTDINTLADEYLRLSYHGLRAKDKSFNATLKTDFDESIGKINIIPQDIGRVVLNLINNAFYAVDEKKKRQPDYEPIVTVSTRSVKSPSGDFWVLISVADNGNGIPQKVLDKIFHPFFTTKPTGQGIGLGLSLSYDIVKAHGGEIQVDTKESAGTEFIIILPVK